MPDRPQRDQSPRGTRRGEVARRRESAQRRQQLWIVGVLACVVVGVGAIVMGAGDDDGAPSTSGPAATTQNPGDPILPGGPGATFASGPPADLERPEPGVAIDGPTPCPAVDGSSPRTTSFSQPPPICIEDDAHYTAVIQTTKGPLRISLNQEASRVAVNNFIVLARYHYFDDVPFTTVAPRGILQTGDPNGDPPGTGTPGYVLPSEVDPAVPPLYTTLTVAAVAEPPDFTTIGSQFFVAVGDDAAGLDPVHPHLGMLLDGMDTVRAIEAIGNVATARPTEDVRITSVEIIES
jgi:cyclophilin family peptidyl-prolyl cis-trans isomerase